MDVSIRQAKIEDSVVVAPLIIEAIDNIAKRLTGESEWGKVEEELRTLFKREDNRHSYLYTYVAELSGKVVGIIVLYPGDKAQALDQNLSKWLENKGVMNTEIDVEALDDELYIDTVCIDSTFRGKGIGSKLFAHAEIVGKEKGYKKLSLNVETKKEDALRLYTRLGYNIVSPWTIIGEPFHHMVKNI